MKQFLALVLLVVATFIHAQDSPKNFKGFIKNNKADSLVVESMRGKFRKALPINDGHFEGLIQQGVGLFSIRVGNKLSTVFLSNDTNLSITADAQDLDGTITFDGEGAAENNVIRQIKRESEAFRENVVKIKDTELLRGQAAQLSESWDVLVKDAKLPFGNQIIVRSLSNTQKHLMDSGINAAEDKIKFTGEPAPLFSYKNINGKTVSLSDFKGKYVYIDVWATWCGPCREEIPHLEKLEQSLKGKNIAFISLSIDKPSDTEKWKKMVIEKHLGGTQLIAENAWDSSMVNDYKIESIPRFILIDPKGNIVDYDAKRPSEPELTTQLSKLLK